MRDGKHNKKLNSSRFLKDLKCPNFKPNTKYINCENFSCGTNAISILTNIHPVKIHKLIPKGYDYWTDRAMIKYLKSKGYEVTEITKSMVTQSENFREYPLSTDHILLVGQFVLI